MLTGLDMHLFWFGSLPCIVKVGRRVGIVERVLDVLRASLLLHCGRERRDGRGKWAAEGSGRLGVLEHLPPVGCAPSVELAESRTLAHRHVPVHTGDHEAETLGLTEHDLASPPSAHIVEEGDERERAEDGNKDVEELGLAIAREMEVRERL